jgi:hypothetical protein
MTITGANPRTAVPSCRRVVPVDREKEKEREREREREPVRERGDQWWTFTTPETRP